MYVYMYIYMYIYIHIYIRGHDLRMTRNGNEFPYNIYIFVYLYHVFMYTCMNISMYICMYT